MKLSQLERNGQDLPTSLLIANLGRGSLRLPRNTRTLSVNRKGKLENGIKIK